MSEYRRLVSYLYFYNRGVKAHNTGFVKAERKNGAIKLLVNLKGGMVPEDKMQVYFFVRKTGAIVGISLGELVIRSGNGEFKAVCSEEELGMAFEELAGVYIKGENADNLFASQWDDLEFSVDKIVEWKDFVDKTAKEAEQEEKEEMTAGKYMTASVEELRESSVSADRAAMEARQENIFREPKIWEMPIKEAIYVQELGSGENENPENDILEAEEKRDIEETVTNEAEPYKIWSDRKETGENMADSAVSAGDMSEINQPDENTCMEQPKPGKTQPQKPWDELFANRTRVSLFADDDIYDCVEITPQDILKLPPEAGHVMSNSFLNHGFFNFHHLMLGRRYNPDTENGLVLGVPGVYNRREKMTANMFGFEKFKFSMRSDVRMNHFGYWYKEY